MYDAAAVAQKADIFVIIGTSLNVYPAAGLVQYVKPGTPIYLIDPKPVAAKTDVQHLMCGASEGVKKLIEILNNG